MVCRSVEAECNEKATKKRNRQGEGASSLFENSQGEGSSTSPPWDQGGWKQVRCVEQEDRSEKTGGGDSRQRERWRDEGARKTEKEKGKRIRREIKEFTRGAERKKDTRRWRCRDFTKRFLGRREEDRQKKGGKEDEGEEEKNGADLIIFTRTAVLLHDLRAEPTLEEGPEIWVVTMEKRLEAERTECRSFFSRGLRESVSPFLPSLCPLATFAPSLDLTSLSVSQSLSCFVWGCVFRLLW